VAKLVTSGRNDLRGQALLLDLDRGATPIGDVLALPFGPSASMRAVERLQAALIDTGLVTEETEILRHTLLVVPRVPWRVVPSATPGHAHLYMDCALDEGRWTQVLHLFTAAGIVEEGYRAASIARGYTSLRLPWVPKSAEEDEACRAKRRERAMRSGNPRCRHCKQAIYFYPARKAEQEGHVYSQAGSDEIGITGVCEWCFDKITAEPDEEKEAR
jgi:hypothetical protein